MSQTVQINITTGGESSQTITDALKKSTTAPRTEAEALINYIQGLASGQYQGSFDLQVNGGASVAASGTIIFSAAASASDTVLINGVVFTARASGATGNEFNIGASATASAANLAAAINASATALVSSLVVGTSSVGTLTITCLEKGVFGNAITIAKGVDSGSVMTVSGARLTGGVAITANVYHYGL